MASMVAGKTDRNGFTWARCSNPDCDDSKKHSWKGHMLIDRKGSTYCFKCGTSTQLSVEMLLQIALGNMSVDEALEEAQIERPELRPWASQRPTKLSTWGADDDPLMVCFPMRDQKGETVGWHDRRPGEKGINVGRRGLGYVGSLKSSPSNPLTIVEGPFDVISDRHVCVFGTISRSSLKYSRLQYVWLQPDPDCLDTAWKRHKFARLIDELEDSCIFVQGVIIGNGDPDEATELVHVKREQVLDWRIEQWT